jgi:hypothetical protein
LHRQKRITTVYATSDEKSSGEKKNRWFFDSEAVNKKAPPGFCQKRSHSGLSPSNEKQGVNQIRTIVNENR